MLYSGLYTEYFGKLLSTFRTKTKAYVFSDTTLQYSTLAPAAMYRKISASIIIACANCPQPPTHFFAFWIDEKKFVIRLYINCGIMGKENSVVSFTLLSYKRD